jgi:hypothetical protein
MPVSLQSPLPIIVPQILKMQPVRRAKVFEYFKNNEIYPGYKTPAVQAGEPMAVNDEGVRNLKPIADWIGHGVSCCAMPGQF